MADVEGNEFSWNRWHQVWFPKLKEHWRYDQIRNYPWRKLTNKHPLCRHIQKWTNCESRIAFLRRIKFKSDLSIDWRKHASLPSIRKMILPMFLFSLLHTRAKVCTSLDFSIHRVFLLEFSIDKMLSLKFLKIWMPFYLSLFSILLIELYEFWFVRNGY